MKPELPSLQEMQTALKAGGHQATPSPQAMDKLREKIRRGIEHPRPAVAPTWRERLGWDADSKPVLLYVSLFAAAVCAVLGFGLLNSRNVKPPAPGDEDPDIAPHLVVRPSGSQLETGSRRPAVGAGGESAPRSTVPVLVKPASDRLSARPQPVSLASTNLGN